MRVHWSSVLCWLLVDITLRKQGKGSLDHALKQITVCSETALMSAGSIAHKLDKTTKANIFSSLFNIYSKSHQIPGYNSILMDLRISRTTNQEKVFLNDGTPLASIRRSIFNN